MARAKEGFERARCRFPGLDHAIRAWEHYGDCRGNELAGAVTYFGFLSFFPLIAVTFAVLGLVVDVYPGAQEQVTSALQQYLPGLVGTGPGQINVEQIAGARQRVGSIGLLGLAYAGLGWVNGLREALRQLFILPPRKGNIVLTKLSDLSVLVLLGTGTLLALAVSSLASALTEQVLELVRLDGSPVAKTFLVVLAPVLSILVTLVILLVIFTRLPGRAIPWREAFEGALIGAVGIQVLMLLAGRLLGGTTRNPVYGAFAVVVGLLVWLNFISRVVLLAAAWAATDKHVPPKTAAEDSSPGTGDHGGVAGGTAGRTTPGAGEGRRSATSRGALVGVAALVAVRRRNGRSSPPGERTGR